MPSNGLGKETDGFILLALVLLCLALMSIYHYALASKPTGVEYWDQFCAADLRTTSSCNSISHRVLAVTRILSLVYCVCKYLKTISDLKLFLNVFSL